MNLLAIFECVILYWLGGRDQVKWWPANMKLFRWIGIGIFLTYYFGMKYHNPIYILCIFTYMIATNVFYYGEGKGSWINLRELFGRGQWFLSGFMFGLASFPILGFYALIQAIIGGFGAYTLLYVSNEGVWQGYEVDGLNPPHVKPNWFLDQNLAEIGICLFGMCVYLFK